MAALAIKALENFIRGIGLPAQLRADAYSLMAAAPRMPGFWQALGRMLHSFAHTGAFSLWACMSARTGLP